MPHVIEVKWEVDLHRHLRAVQLGNGLRAGTFMHTSARNCPCTATSFFLVALVIRQSVLMVINNLDAPFSLCKGKRSSAIQSNIHVLGKMQKIFSTTLSGKSLKKHSCSLLSLMPSKVKKGENLWWQVGQSKWSINFSLWGTNVVMSLVQYLYQWHHHKIPVTIIVTGVLYVNNNILNLKIGHEWCISFLQCLYDSFMTNLLFVMWFVQSRSLSFNLLKYYFEPFSLTELSVKSCSHLQF